MGGIGNVLFQVAMLLAYSLKHKVEYCLPIENTSPHYPEQKPFIFPNLNYCDTPTNLPLYLEKEFTYNEVPPMDGVKFQGYWQSEKYFSEYREEILKAFDIPYELKEEWVACHIRRGDFLNLQNYHPVVTLEYIYEAIFRMHMLGYNKFMFFSDDIDWCIENIGRPNGCTFEFSEGRTELEDLSLASSCESVIGSNSSFSWWIYYLNRNENKIGIFPKKSDWFGAALPHNVDDLYNKKWVLI